MSLTARVWILLLLAASLVGVACGIDNESQAETTSELGLVDRLG